MKRSRGFYPHWILPSFFICERWRSVNDQSVPYVIHTANVLFLGWNRLFATSLLPQADNWRNSTGNRLKLTSLNSYSTSSGACHTRFRYGPVIPNGRSCVKHRSGIRRTRTSHRSRRIESNLLNATQPASDTSLCSLPSPTWCCCLYMFAYKCCLPVICPLFSTIHQVRPS